jgi:hypothetical protein
VVDLDVLAGGDVALVERRVLLDDVGEGVHLLRGDAAEGQLDPDHLHVGLALAVNALFEPEADELVFRQALGEELLGFVVEVVELALDDRDHVAGDVLVRLGVLERAEAALASLLLVLGYHDIHAEENSKTRQGFRYLALSCPFSCLQDGRGFAGLGHVAVLGLDR